MPVLWLEVANRNTQNQMNNPYCPHGVTETKICLNCPGGFAIAGKRVVPASDTPETDAVRFSRGRGVWIVNAEFMREMERQRDKANQTIVLILQASGESVKRWKEEYDELEMLIQRAIDILDGNEDVIDWHDKDEPELLRKLCEHLEAKCGTGSKIMKCNNCGVTPKSEDARYCRMCGQPLEQSVSGRNPNPNPPGHIPEMTGKQISAWAPGILDHLQKTPPSTDTPERNHEQ